MTIKYLTGAYSAGYTLNEKYSGLVIESTATINAPGGIGVDVPFTASIQNDGVVNAGVGVYLSNGGSVTNGSATDTKAQISGAFVAIVVAGASGAIANFATIQGGGNGGVSLRAGGTVTNGSAADTMALIAGASGVYVQNAAGVGAVANFGTILASDGKGFLTNNGVFLGGGGAVTNGSATDTKALIGGYVGIGADYASATVVNFGTILATTVGAYLLDGGKVTNGSAHDTKALIDGVVIDKAPGAVANFGTIQSAHFEGVGLGAGGTVTNGSAADTKALIAGYTGVTIYGASAAVTNFGTIQAIGTTVYQRGVYLAAGGTLTNGSATATKASIAGFTGVVIGPGQAATVNNFGTISGTGGVALAFQSANDVLVAEASSVFNGAVLGGGGGLRLATGAGTIANLGSGNLSVSEGAANNTFTNFGAVEIGKGARFTLLGSGSVDATHSLRVDGTLSVAGSLTVAGGLANTGAILDNGTSVAIGGDLKGVGADAISGAAILEIGSSFGKGTKQAVSFAAGSTGTFKIDRAQLFTGTLSGLATGRTLDLANVNIAGAILKYAGNETGGTLTVSDGTTTAKIALIGDYTQANFATANDGAGHTDVTYNGTGAAAAGAAVSHRFIAAMAAMTAPAGAPIHTHDTATIHAPMLVGPRVSIA